MSGDIPIQAGSYAIDDDAWFEVRLTDLGWQITFCDRDRDAHFSITVDKGEVVSREIGTLEPD